MENEGEASAANRPKTPLAHIDGSIDGGNRNRSSTGGSGGRVRNASLRFLESSPPSGMWSATGQSLAQAPTPLEIRRGSFGRDGWDGRIQRRNSTVSEESIRRLSRTSSAQTPTGLARTTTNTMDAHAEAEDEGQEMSTDRKFSPRPQKNVSKPADAEDDEDDPFSKFLGRGKIESQEYIPKAKTSPTTKLAAKRRSADPYAIPDDDDDDEDLDTLEEAQPSEKRPLPKKFQDPAGEQPPTTVTTGAVRDSQSSTDKEQGPNAEGVYPNGYKFPPKHTWAEATKIGFLGFWKFFTTPFGFLVVIYGLNVVAWGGMLFLLLIPGQGSQFMCYPPGSHGEKDCNNIDSPRRIWIEIDSQILNALFCVTGFGLIPWRFRDFYYLLHYRIRHQESALRKLAGIHRSWFRLPGSHELPTDPAALVDHPGTNSLIPIPPTKIPDNPLTGIRAPATKLWKMDYVVWAFVINTFLQAVLSGFMWGFNRYTRPSWSTGTFVALACIVAGLGGLMQFLEGKRIKAVEGIPVSEFETIKDLEKNVAPVRTGVGKDAEKLDEKGGKDFSSTTI